MSLSARVITFALVVLEVPSSAAQSKAAVLSALRQWTDAVVQHTPSTLDQAVRTVWALTPEDRKAVDDHLASLVKVLNGTPVPYDWSEEASITSTLAERMNATVFLERAAMLHADAVMLDHRPAAAIPAGGTSTVLVEARDGEVVGTAVANWNWPFARGLLDRITPVPGNEPFVAIWYHATTAYMFRNAQFGEASGHLAHAAIVVPNDPRVLFDRGCLSEAQSMSNAQQLVSDDRAAQLFNSYRGGRMGLQAVQPSINLPPADEGNARAADLFQRALEVEPALVEARVRLARLLDLRKRYADAEVQVGLALKGEPDREVAFFAHLFGARAANGLAHGEEAEGHVQAALALFPRAGSALLAASETALRRADAAAALSRLDGLGAAPADPATEIDPWLEYAYGLRRSAERALIALWRAVPPIAPKGPAALR